MKGFKNGEMAIIAAGRQTGKSMLNQLYWDTHMSPPKFHLTARAQVDGETWYTVTCTPAASEWLRSQPKEWRYEALAHGWSFPQFDIHEKLYTLLALRWS